MKQRNNVAVYLCSKKDRKRVVESKKDKGSLKNKANVLLALLAFVFSIWVIIGCGQEVVFYGFILLMIGIPFYIYINNSSDD